MHQSLHSCEFVLIRSWYRDLKVKFFIKIAQDTFKGLVNTTHMKISTIMLVCLTPLLNPHGKAP